MDIPFVDGGGHDQQLDLYTPAGSGFPTIMFVHEGSLTSGDRKDEPYAQMCQIFQDAGIACAEVILIAFFCLATVPDAYSSLSCQRMPAISRNKAWNQRASPA